MEPDAKKPIEGVSFYEGRPIAHFAEDTLARKDFARFFAETITRHHGRESLVLAVNGAWGEGKTSFKNMVVDLLEQEHDDRVVTLTFSPWEWASQNQVSGAFFTEIAKQLEAKDPSENAKNAAQRFSRLGRYLGLTGNLVSPSGMFLEPLLPGSTIVTVALGKGLQKARDLAREAATEMDKAAEEAKRSLPSIKGELRATLQKYLDDQKKLILVVIDDIDRLSPDEIRLVFQMVRINADFPALVFLLLYEEEFIVRSLEKYFCGSGKRFLEKIVQFQIGLPVLVDNRLRDYVAEELAKVFATRPAYAALFEIERFHNAWSLGVGAYINNLRRAGRLLSSFEFHLGAFQSGDAEVNPIDFLILEVLRLFESAFYQQLYEQGDSLFPTLEERVFWQLERKGQKEELKDSWQKRLDVILENVSTENKSVAKQLLEDLFPVAGVGRGFYGLDTKEAARKRRLSHILYFNRYFRLTVDTWDVPESEVSAIEASMAEPGRFIDSLRNLKKQNKLQLVLTKLLARDKLQISVKPVEMIGELCRFGEEIQDVENQKNLISPTQALMHLFGLQLPTTLSSSERLERIINGIEHSQAVRFSVEIAESEDQTEHQFAKADVKERYGIGPHLERNDIAKLNEYVADRLENALLKDQSYRPQDLVRATTWYLDFMEKRVQKKTEDILKNLRTLEVVLLAVINEQSFAQYKDGSSHFAGVPLVRVKNCFGLERFDKALEIHESELMKAGNVVSKRLLMYRDMRKRFTYLTEPKSLESAHVEG